MSLTRLGEWVGGTRDIFFFFFEKDTTNINDGMLYGWDDDATSHAKSACATGVYRTHSISCTCIALYIR